MTRTKPSGPAASADPQDQLIGLSADNHRVPVMDRYRAFIRFLVVTIALVSACSSSTPASSGPTVSASIGSGPTSPAAGTTRTSEGGEVTVVVDWAGPADGAVFDVKLDTHSIDLDALDLAGAILRNDRGETLSAEPWAAPKGGHHREGAITFEGDTASFFSGASWVELVLSGVGDLAERTLRWEITE